MILDILGETFSSLARPAAVAIPYVLGLLVAVVAGLVLAGLWWARPQHEPDPVEAIDPTASDWLGQP